MLQTRVLQSYDELAPLIPAWGELVLRAEVVSIFQTPEWAIGWWRAMQTDSTLFCVALFEDERLVGFAPFCIERKWGMRIVRGMGGDANDSDGMFSEACYGLELERAVFNALGKVGTLWDAVHLCVPTQPCSVEAISRCPMPPDWVQMPMRPTPLPKIPLPATWDLYWNGLSRERRRIWSRYRRRLDEQGGLKFVLFTTGEEVALELPIFLQTRERNWRQRNNRRRMIAFQRNLRFAETLNRSCTALAEREQVWLGQLGIGGKAIAWELAFRLKDTLWSYMTTYAPEHAQYSPGTWVALEVARHAIECGLTSIEAGRGNQPHKFWRGAHPGSNRNLLIAQRNPRGMAVLAAEWLRERAVGLYGSLC